MTGGFVDTVREVVDKYGDPRIDYYPLMSSPWPMVAIISTYILGVKVIGPKLMEKRKPYDLKTTMYYYNLLQIVISIYALYEAYVVGWFTDYSWTCQPIDKSDTPINRRLVRGVWLYHILKYIEFLDTIFFVMRKKNNQVSKLHVYHHSIMPINSWMIARFLPGGHATFGGVLNSFVHLVMYTYYLLAALGPAVQKYLWWKKYITMLQMGQFVLIFFHSLQLLFNGCDYPHWFAYFTLPQAVIFLWLFKNFYDNAYKKDQQKASLRTRLGGNANSKTEISSKKNSRVRNRKPADKIEASR